MSASKAYRSKLQYETNTTNCTGGLNSTRNMRGGLNSSRNGSEMLNSARSRVDPYLASRNRYEDMKFDFVESLQFSNQGQPSIDEKTREQIMRKQNIYESVIQNWRHRQNKNDYFLPYNYNPFVTTHTQYEEKKREEKRLGVKILNLIEQLDRKTQEIPQMNHIIEKSKKDIDFIAKQSMIRSGKFVNNLGKLNLDWNRRSVSPENGGECGSKILKKSAQLKQQVEVPLKKRVKKQQAVIKAKQVEKYLDIEIETIAGQKQLSYFAKNKHENHINIFKINEESELKNYTTILEQLRFNFESVVDKLPSVKIPYLRDLSQLGRGVLVNNYKGKELIENHVDMRQNTFLFHEISYDNIMCIATNRISPQTIQMFMKTNLAAVQSMDDDKSEVEEEQLIIYDKDMVQRQMNYETYQQQKQVWLYHNMSFSQEQEQAHRFYEEKSVCIENQLNFKSYLFENMIQEQKVHDKLQRIIEKQFKGYLKQNKGYEDEDYVRLMNKNKYKKDRKQLIKIKELKRMLVAKNLNDEKDKSYFIKQEIMKIIKDTKS